MSTAPQRLEARSAIGGEFREGGLVVFAAAFGAAAGVTGMSVYALSVLVGPMTETFGWSRGEFAGAKTAATLGFMLTAPFVGLLADRVGARPLGMASLVLLVFAMFGMTQLGPTVASLYGFYFVMAVLGCATTPLVWTRGVATWFREKRGLAMALTLSGPGLIGVITPTLLDTLITRYDWRAGYIAMGCVAAIALVPVALFFRERPAAPVVPSAATTTPATGLSVREAAATRWFWQIGLAFLLIGGVVSALMVHVVPLMMDAGLDRALAIRIAGVLAATVIAGRLVTGWLVDRFHPPLVAAVFLIMPVLGCLLLADEQVAPAIVLLAVASIGLAAGSEVDLVPYLTARYFGLKAYGRIYSWMFVAFYAGVALGPVLLGIAYDQDGNYRRALMSSIPVLAVGVALVATLGRAPIASERT